MNYDDNRLLCRGFYFRRGVFCSLRSRRSCSFVCKLGFNDEEEPLLLAYQERRLNRFWVCSLEALLFRATRAAPVAGERASERALLALGCAAAPLSFHPPPPPVLKERARDKWGQVS